MMKGYGFLIYRACHSQPPHQFVHLIEYRFYPLNYTKSPIVNCQKYSTNSSNSFLLVACNQNIVCVNSFALSCFVNFIFFISLASIFALAWLVSLMGWCCFIQWYTGCCCCWCWGRARQPHWTSCRSNSSGLCWMVSGKKESRWLSTFESFHWTRFPNICTTVTGFFAKYISASLTVFFTDSWYIWVCFQGGGTFHPWVVTVLSFFV